MGADDPGAPGRSGEEVVDPGGGAIEDGHRIAVIVHIEDQILAHHRQSDETDIGSCGHENSLEMVDDR